MDYHSFLPKYPDRQIETLRQFELVGEDLDDALESEGNEDLFDFWDLRLDDIKCHNQEASFERLKSPSAWLYGRALAILTQFGCNYDDTWWLD